MNKQKIIFALLNWGLGHATRSMSLIKFLMAKGYEIHIIASGRSLLLLKKEFPQIPFIDIGDYDIKYTKSKALFLPYMFLQIPKILFCIIKEHVVFKKIISKINPDYIISDNRYGIFSTKIPSFFLTHQVRIKLPGILKNFEFIGEFLNSIFFLLYKKVLVFDYKNSPNLSGNLSHNLLINSKKLRYIGPFADVKKTEIDDLYKSEILILISGPEPQRTLFEKIIFDDLSKLSGKIIIILGKPEKDEEVMHNFGDNIKIYNNLKREIIVNYINNTNYVVSRSGYSTVMELVALEKKAIFIPTPGQTEQEYLAEIYMKNNLFFSVEQNRFDLKNDLKRAKKFYKNNGILNTFKSVNDVEKFYSEIIEK